MSLPRMSRSNFAISNVRFGSISEHLNYIYYSLIIVNLLTMLFFVIANAVKQSKFYNEMYLQNRALPTLRECFELRVFARSGLPLRFAEELCKGLSL